MARLSPEQRRAAIVDATLEVMLRRGIAATTVRDVAAQMGTSSGLIHHYFASMDDLLAEAFDKAATEDFARTQAAVAEQGNPLDQLRVFLAAYNRTGEDWSMQLWLDAWAEAARHPALGRTSRRINEQWQSLVADLLRSGAAEGTFSCDDPDAAAWRVVSLLDGLTLQLVAHEGVISRDSVVTWAAQGVAGELGLAAESL